MSPKRACAIVFFGLLESTACGRAPSAEITDRLWVSSMPAGPRDSTHAFVITNLRGRKLGSFYTGSVYAGRHEMFSFQEGAKNRGRITLLQNNVTYEVQVTTCQPTRGFDLCVELKGDPTHSAKYQSRKRWVIPGRGRRDAAPDVAELVETLALAVEE